MAFNNDDLIKSWKVLIFVIDSISNKQDKIFPVEISSLIISWLVTEDFYYLQLSRIIVCVHKNSRETQIQLLSNLVNEQWQGNRFTQYHVDIILNAHNHMKISLAQ